MTSTSTCYVKEVTNCLRSHTPRVVILKYIGGIFGAAYLKAATMSTAIDYFLKMCTFPFNPDMFEDSEFMPAESTNKPRTEMPSPTIMPLISIPRFPDLLIEILQNILDTVEDISNTIIEIDYMHPGCSYTT